MFKTQQKLFYNLQDLSNAASELKGLFFLKNKEKIGSNYIERGMMYPTTTTLVIYWFISLLSELVILFFPNLQHIITAKP